MEVDEARPNPPGFFVVAMGMDAVMPATVSEYSFGGWSIGLWVAQLFDEEKAARLAHSLICELKDVLSASGPVDLSMPDFGAWDIVAKAPLKWRGYEYLLIVNTSDGVVAIDHPEREPLDELLGAIQHVIHVTA